MKNNKNLVLLVLLLNLILFINVLNMESVAIFNYSMQVDYSYLVTLIILFMVSLSLIPELTISKELVSFILFNLLAISLIYFSKNLLFVILGLELVTISLIGLYFSNKRKRATIFYFFASGLATALLVLSYSYGSLATMVIIAALCIKLGVAPLHQYVPYLYLKESITDEDRGQSAIMYLYTISKGLLMLFIRLFNTKVIFVLGVINLIVGVYNGLLNRNKWFPMFIFSSISHIGYLLLSISSNVGLFYLISNIITTVIIVFVLLDSLKRSNSRIDRLNITGLNPLVMVVFISSILSLLGIPPFIGFFGKLFIIEDVFEYGNWVYSFIILFASCLSCGFYLCAIKSLLLNKGFLQCNENSKTLKWVLSGISLVLVFIFIDKFAEYLILCYT